MTMMFREEVASDPAGFHAGPLPWSNWNLEMLVFQENNGEPGDKSSGQREK